MIKIHNFARGARGQRVMWQCEEMGLPYVVENHPFPVGEGYRALTRQEPKRIVMIDGSGDIDEIEKKIWEMLSSRFSVLAKTSGH